MKNRWLLLIILAHCTRFLLCSKIIDEVQIKMDTTKLKSWPKVSNKISPETIFLHEQGRKYQSEKQEKVDHIIHKNIAKLQNIKVDEQKQFCVKCGEEKERQYYIVKKIKKYSLTKEEKLKVKVETCYICEQCKQLCSFCHYESPIQFLCDDWSHRHIFCGCIQSMIRDAVNNEEREIPDFRVVDANRLEYIGFDFFRYLCKNCEKKLKMTNRVLCPGCVRNLLWIVSIIFPMVTLELYALLEIPILTLVYIASGEDTPLSYLQEFIFVWSGFFAGILACLQWRSLRKQLYGTYFHWVPVILIDRLFRMLPRIMTISVGGISVLFRYAFHHFFITFIFFSFSLGHVLYYLIEMNKYFHFF